MIGAALHGHTDVCCLLLDHGSSLEEREFGTDNTALHEAALFGHLATVAALLDWTPEKAGTLVNLKNQSGFTPLTTACQEGHLDCVLLLLEAGAEPLQTHQGSWPTHVAAKRNHVAVVETLLDFGCGLELVGMEVLKLYPDFTHKNNFKNKGNLPLPKRMNFRKSSKRPLTPPPLIFGKLCCNFLN